MGHLGTDRVFQLARQRVYWPGMYSDLDDFIHNKCTCIVQRLPSRKLKAPLQSIQSSHPMELVAIDFLHLEKSSGGHKYILLIVDHFSRYAQVYPTRNKSALTTAKYLYSDFILRFGIPSRIIHDQSGEFENRLFLALKKFSGIVKARTTPYHLQGNGAVERMNRTLLQMLRTLPENQKKRWHEKVNKMTFVYNTTRHDSTGFTPYFLLFGREPKLPLDQLIHLPKDAARKTHSQYAEAWQQQMEQAYRIAFEKSSKQKDMDRKRWIDRPHLMALQVGDRVLVKNVVERCGPGKLRSYWEQNIYIIKVIHGEGNVVYSIQQEGDPKAKIRVVHRNMLMSCGDLQLDETKDSEQKRQDVPRRCCTRSKKKEEVSTLPSSDESEDEGFYPDQLDMVPQGYGPKIGERKKTGEGMLLRDAQEYQEEDQQADNNNEQEEENEDMDNEVQISDSSTIEYAEEETDLEDELAEEVETEVEIRSKKDDQDATSQERRSQRIRKAPKVFTYEEPGKPSIEIIKVREKLTPANRSDVYNVQGMQEVQYPMTVPGFVANVGQQRMMPAGVYYQSSPISSGLQNSPPAWPPVYQITAAWSPAYQINTAYWNNHPNVIPQQSYIQEVPYNDFVTH